MKPYSSTQSCSPSRRRKGGSQEIQSCFTYQSLARIARRYNEQNEQNKIKLYRNRNQLWKAIRTKIPDCDNERCWIRSRFLETKDKKTLLEDFKPPIPLGQHTWLNTQDINQVLAGYERIFPAFKFLKTHPIDFQDVYPKKFNPLNVTALRKAGKKMAAMVLNLDKSDEPGSHWVAVVLDLENRVFEYFDSYGDVPPVEVKRFYQQLNKRSRNGWKFKVNKTVHQQKDSECGVYSIHFVVRRVSGTPFKKASEEVIRDAKMNQNRREYFDPHNSYNNHI